MEKGIVPLSGIDTYARWGYSHTKGMDIWIQTTHGVSTTGSIVVPLSAADITTANVQDNQVYYALTSYSSLPSTTLKKTHYMIADSG